MKELPAEPPPFPSEILKRGSADRERIKEWQSMLAFDADYGIKVDGSFGDETVYCTKLFQGFRGLPQTGEVDVVTWDELTNGVNLPKYTRILTKKFTPAYRCRIDVIVIHTMESPHKKNTAEANAAWLAKDDTPKASAHYFVDFDGDIVQSVRDHHIAWGCPGLNSKGLHIEHAGFARFTRSEWLSGENFLMLQKSAKLASEKARKYNIPIKFHDADALKRGERGLAGHKQGTDAFSAGAGHWDPGPGWPWDVYLDLVRSAK